MSELILLPGDLIANSEQELPQEFLNVKREAEAKAALEVLPDEVTNARVAQEHASIWAPREPLAVPSEFTESGRKA
jgi:hypothetical protein